MGRILSNTDYNNGPTREFELRARQEPNGRWTVTCIDQDLYFEATATHRYRKSAETRAMKLVLKKIQEDRAFRRRTK